MVNKIKVDMPLPEEVVVALIELNKVKRSQSYVVGGCVRDFLLGKKPKDYDICTNLLPEQILECFKDYQIINNNGIKHGTVTVRILNENIEITTFRVEEESEDHRHPKGVKFVGKLKTDLSRRDLTINALAYDGQYIYDYFGGYEDLQNKIIRCVGTPYKRYNEDVLRVLRAIRFASVLDFNFEENTLNDILYFLGDLRLLSKERIKSELDKMIVGKAFPKIASIPNVMNCLCTIIPELRQCVDFNQHNPYHKHDVYRHLLAVVNNIEDSSNYILKLACLFHDIGKPVCFQVDEEKSTQSNPYYHFIGHADKSKEISERVLNSLKYSNDEKLKICWLIRNHDYVVAKSRKSIRKFLATIPVTLDKEEMFLMWLDLREADRKDHIYTDVSKIIPIIDLKNYYYELKESKEESFSIKNLAVNGYDLLDLNLRNVAIGNTLNTLLNLVIEEELSNDKTQLLDYVKRNILNK